MKSKIKNLYSLIALGLIYSCNQNIPSNINPSTNTVNNNQENKIINSVTTKTPSVYTQESKEPAKIIEQIINNNTQNNIVQNQKENDIIIFNYGFKVYMSDSQAKTNTLLVDLLKDDPNISLWSPEINFTLSTKKDKVAFLLNKSSGYELYIITISDKKINKIKTDSYFHNLAWSDDGKTIITLIDNKVAKINSDNLEIKTFNNPIVYKKDSNGKLEEVSSIDLNLLKHRINSLVLSPDSDKMILSGYSDQDYIFGFKYNEIRKTIADYNSRWIDNNNIYILSGNRLSILNIDDNKITQISKDSEKVYSYTFSKDNRALAYAYKNENSSTLKLKITNSNISKEIDLPVSDYSNNISLSPDNKKVLINDSKNTFIVNIDNANIKSLQDFQSNKWLSDSKTIFLKDNSNEPFLYNTETNEKINLYIRPINPLISEFNIKVPSESEVNELKSSKIVDSNTKFGLKLFNSISDKESNKNIFISPLSVSLALSMVYNGASNNTLTQISNALEYQNFSKELVNKYNNNILKLLLTEQDIQLSIANSIFSKQGYSFNSDFINTNKLNYYSEIKELTGNLQTDINNINSWVNEKTNNIIPKIIDNISPDEIIFLLNTIYFKGTWTDVFEKSLTENKPFYLENNSTKNVPMMKQSGYYTYFKDSEVEFIRLPYGKNQRFGMYIFLTNKGTKLEQFRRELNIEKLNMWLSESNNKKGNITIPKFLITNDINLQPHLESLGITDAFKQSQSDFNDMSKSKISLSRAIHKSFINVNEEGTEAAAVTIIGGLTPDIGHEPIPFNFVADRPFIYTIVDNTTKSVLFIGSIYDL